MNPAEKLAREIAREALFLPERWRLWLFEQLREDCAAVDMEQHQVERLHKKMADAIAALERVAQHLGLIDEREQLALTIREFDAAPESVRQGWKGRRVGEVIRGSWFLAKEVAFQEGWLPVEAEHQRKRSKDLSRKSQESTRVLPTLERWLQSNPAKKTKAAYDQWREQERAQLAPGQRSPVDARRILRRWPGCTWAEILQAVEANKVPGEQQDNKQPTKAETGETPAWLAELEKQEANALRLDHKQRGQVFKAAREAQGLNIETLSQLVGIDRSTLDKIEQGNIPNSSFQSIAKLADALNLSLDALTTERLNQALTQA